MRIALRFLAFLPLLAAPACDRVDPDAAMVASQPGRLPMRSSTPFSGALTCLNRLLVAQAPVAAAAEGAWPRHMLNFPISVGLVPDATGRVNPGLRDMITTAISIATQSTGRYMLTEASDITSSPTNAQPGSPSLGGGAIGMQVGPQTLPGLQIIGSLSQVDTQIQTQSTEAGLGIRDNTFGISMNGDVSTVGTDLRLIRLEDRRVRANTSNTLVFRNRNFALNADFRLGRFGANFEYSIERREGPHQAVRTLIELSVVELIGSHAGVDYWQCFQIGHNHPAVRQQTANWYRDMTAAERDAYLRARLVALDGDVPPPPARPERALRAFQQARNLVPTGLMDYETFHALVTAGLPADTPLPTARPAPAPDGPVRLSVDVAENQVDNRLSLEVRADRIVHVRCYYRDDEGRILTIYPNPFEAPDTLHPINVFHIPPRPFRGAQELPFLIQPRQMTPEVGFLCLASSEDLAARLPRALQVADFQPIGLRSFDAVIQAFRTVAPGDLGFVIASRDSNRGRWIELQQPFVEQPAQNDRPAAPRPSRQPAEPRT